MALFEADEFTLHFDDLELSYPTCITAGEDLNVRSEVKTGGDSDDYRIYEIQLWLDTDDRKHLLHRENPDSLYLGGTIERTTPYEVDVDGQEIEELLEDDEIAAGESYRLQGHVIFQEAFTGREQYETCWGTPGNPFMIEAC